MNKTIVIGGGAAGMMAAVFAARNGQDVTLYEQNEKLGKKLFITGKGRCNVTNDAPPEELLSNVISNPKFLYSAFYDFNAQDCMAFFEQLGVRLKVERGNRVFPQSDHSSDIIRALEYELRRLSVKISLNSPVKALWTEDLPESEIINPKKEPTKKCLGIILQDGKKEKSGSCDPGNRWRFLSADRCKRKRAYNGAGCGTQGDRVISGACPCQDTGDMVP